MQPIALSRQATADGQYLAFLGRAKSGAVGSYILRLSDGQLRSLAGAGTRIAGAPAISADNGTIALATAAALAPGDRNKSTDVFVVDNPFENAQLAAPSITLSASPNGGEIVDPASVTLGATATSARGFLYTAIEVDGVEVKRTDAGGTVAPFSYPLPLGVHKVRAVTIDGANIPALSAERTFIVKPGPNQVLLRGVKDLVRSGDAGGGAVDFSGVLQIDNTFATSQGPLRVLLIEVANNAHWDIFGNGTPITRPERVLDVLSSDDAASTVSAPSTPTELAFTGVTRPPEVASLDGFQGVGYTVYARLQKFASGAWSDLGTPLTLFQLAPRLDDGTPGPNGGTPVLDSSQSDATFNPVQVSSVSVSGVPAIAGGTRRTYTASAVFTNANPSTRVVTPKWSVAANGVSAFISSTGVLSVGNVALPRVITVQADLGGKTGTLEVTVKPGSPAVSIRALAPTVSESAQTAFRILRTPVTNQPLDVTYTFGGLANSPFRQGTDYPPFTGKATIPAGQAAFTLPLVPDATETLIEGNETVSVTLSPSGDYRLGTPATATITIDDDDDDPLPPTVVDATISRGAGRPAGVKIYAFGDQQAAQSVSAGLRVNVPVSFTIGIVNRSSGSQTIGFPSAGADFNGYRVRYFLGTRDVTEAVLADTLDLTGSGSSLAPGAAVKLRMQITATEAAPLNSTFPCFLEVAAQGGFSDYVLANVRRVR